MPTDMTTEKMWRAILTGQPQLDLHRNRLLYRLLPANPRCKNCNAPFRGIGAPIMSLLGRRPSSKNPRFCNNCDNFARTHPGGAEVELSLLFVDVRGSTALAENMTPAAFSRLINRFYAVATDVLVNTDAMIDKLVGDEVIGLYFPGFAGSDFARKALEGARGLLRATGHGELGGPWLPIGVGVHTGIAYVGTVEGAGGTVRDITALGDAVNTTARLASKAGPGEALISDAACAASRFDLSNLERRRLDLKGKSEPVGVRVMRVTLG